MQRKLWNKDYLLMLQGGAVSALGDILHSVAIGYWVYEKTGSNALMGVMSSISLFMTMLVMPFSGAVIDKCDRKAVIVGMDALRGVIMLVVGALACMERLTVGVVIAAAFLASGCSVFFEPAVSTLMIDLIPPGEMVRGQSVQEGVSTAVSMAGKALSGALTAYFGVGTIILWNGVSYLLSAATELFVAVPKTVQQGNGISLSDILRDLGRAGRSVWKDPFLRLFGISTVAINLLAAGPLMLKLAFTMEKGFSLEQYGLLMTAETAAMLLSAILLGAVKLRPEIRRWVMTAGFLSGIVFMLAGYGAERFGIACVFLALGSFANTMGNSIFNAALMLAVPEENRGAILGLVSAVSMGGGALSTVVYGILCDCFPLVRVFLAGTLLALIPMLVLCFHKKTKQFMLAH